MVTGEEESLLLSEKDGALSINTGIGEIPIKLSDDGKELYVERRQYVKTDAAMKDKIIVHQKKCGQTIQAYLDTKGVAVKPNVSAASGGTQAIKTAV